MSADADAGARLKGGDMPIPKQFAADIALLIARLGLGVILIAHGWDKLVTVGIEPTADQFADWGVPLPMIATYYATIVELFGGIVLVLGLTVRVIGGLVVLDMLGAIVFVHLGNGVFVQDNGFELALAVALCAGLLVVFRGGRFGLDHLYSRGSRHRKDTAKATSEGE